MLVFLLTLVAAVPVPQLPTPDTLRLRTQDVRYASDSLVLAAELLLPAAREPVAAVVVVQGSGPSNRSNAWARSMATELLRHNVAVLLTDKRGSGASQGSWQTAGFDELARDAIAGVAYLRSRREIDPARIGLLGLSQGGWIAPVAAARDPRIAFVITVSGAAVGFAEQNMVEMANTARQMGLSPGAVRAVLQLNRAAGRYVMAGDWAGYAQARTRALTSDARRIAEGYPPTPELPIWSFLRKVAPFDPIPHWLLVDAPVLVAYGSEDEHDNVPVAESVRRLEHAFAAAGKTNHQIVVVPGAGHALWEDEPTQRLAPQFTRALEGWLLRHVTGPAARRAAR